jgi:hypothetical protein
MISLVPSAYCLCFFFGFFLFRSSLANLFFHPNLSQFAATTLDHSSTPPGVTPGLATKSTPKKAPTTRPKKKSSTPKQDTREKRRGPKITPNAPQIPRLYLAQHLTLIQQLFNGRLWILPLHERVQSGG